MCLCTQGTRLVLPVPGHTVEPPVLVWAGRQTLPDIRGLKLRTHVSLGRQFLTGGPGTPSGAAGDTATLGSEAGGTREGAPATDWESQGQKQQHGVSGWTSHASHMISRGPRRAIRSCSGTAEQGGSGTHTRAQDESAQGQGLDPQERRKRPQSWRPATSCGPPGNGSVLPPPSGEASPRRVPPSLCSLWPPASHSGEALSHLRRQPITSVYGGNGKLH